MQIARPQWGAGPDRGLVPTPRDVLLLGYLPVVALLSWLLPEATWPSLCAAAARLSGYAGRKRAENTRHIARLLAARVSSDGAASIAAEIGAHHHHTRLQLFRCYRFDSWHPCIELIGREHLEAALEAGAGGILWLAPFVYGTLVTKMAVHRAGFALSHLSGRQHGLSTSPFGQRFLNPIWTSVERRYLAERVVMASAEAPGALRELMRRLKRNELVSIAMGPNGRRRHSTPFFDGQITVANGAPALAQRTGAVLLPVFTVRAADGSFVTTIEAPPPLAADLSEEDFVQAMVAHCGRLLESYVWRYPTQFNGWAMAE